MVPRLPRLGARRSPNLLTLVAAVREIAGRLLITSIRESDAARRPSGNAARIDAGHRVAAVNPRSCVSRVVLAVATIPPPAEYRKIERTPRPGHAVDDLLHAAQISVAPL